MEVEKDNAMRTDALIEALARDAAPISAYAVERRLACGAIVGAGLTLLMAMAALGFRDDLAVAMAGIAFWSKAAYPLGAGLAAILVTIELARPDTQTLRRPWLVLVPALVLLPVAILELMKTAPPGRLGLLLDPAWTCVPLILLLSVPIFTGLVVALRRLAPTRLHAAGAAAGLAASGFAGTLYCLSCQQESPVFLITRYTAAIALGSLIGALLGPKLLRW